MKYQVLERRTINEDPSIILTTDDLGHAKKCMEVRTRSNDKKRLHYTVSIRRIADE